MPIVSGGGTGLSIATVKLTHAQIIALPTTSVPLVTAPGANKVLVPFLSWWYFNWTADYTGIDATSRLGIEYGTAANSSLLPFANSAAGLTGLSDLLADGVSHHAYTATKLMIQGASSGVGAIGQIDEPGIANADLNIYAVNGANFTGGNAANTLQVTLYYTTLTLA